VVDWPGLSRQHCSTYKRLSLLFRKDEQLFSLSNANRSIIHATSHATSIRKRVDTQRGKKRTNLEVALAESEKRLLLVQAGCQTYKNLLDFIRTMNASERQNQDLDSVIDDLSRTVPGLANAGAATAQSQIAISSVVSQRQAPLLLTLFQTLSKASHTGTVGSNNRQVRGHLSTLAHD